MISSAGQASAAIPESSSLQVQWTVTAPKCPPVSSAGVVVAPVIVGATWSMLMPDTVVLTDWPNVSVAVPVTDWFSPSVDTVAGSVHDARASPEQVNDTVTGSLLHPSAF